MTARVNYRPRGGAVGALNTAKLPGSSSAQLAVFTIFAVNPDPSDCRRYSRRLYVPMARKETADGDGTLDYRSIGGLVGGMLRRAGGGGAHGGTDAGLKAEAARCDVQHTKRRRR